MDKLKLNNPLVRQSMLKRRLIEKEPLVASALAEEFGVSQDTIRRDLLALESDGVVQRVRGGAIAVSQPVVPLTQRIDGQERPLSRAIISAAKNSIEDGMVILMDGGATVTSLAQALPALPNSLIVTPAPTVALAALAHNIQTILVGGRLSALGGVAVGSDAEKTIANINADICFMGACALNVDGGLSSDDFDESALKKQMRASAQKLVVLASAQKFGLHARHKTLLIEQIDTIVTDDKPDDYAGFIKCGVEVSHA